MSQWERNMRRMRIAPCPPPSLPPLGEVNRECLPWKERQDRRANISSPVPCEMPTAEICYRCFLECMNRIADKPVIIDRGIE